MGTLAAGIKDIFSTAKTTGTNVMLCGNDGTPDGHISMANLTSVLGANSVQSVRPGDTVNCLYFCMIGVCWFRSDGSLSVGNLYLKYGTNLSTIIETSEEFIPTVNDVSHITINGRSGSSIYYIAYPNI